VDYPIPPQTSTLVFTDDARARLAAAIAIDKLSKT